MKRSLISLVVVAGCATGLQTVPKEDWQTVPPAERAAIDRAHDSEIAQTDAELRVATAAVADVQRVRPIRAAVAAPIPPDNAWADAIRAHEHSKADTLAQIDAATIDWQRAALAWRELRVTLLTAQLDVLRSTRELERARAVDHHLLGTDTYDTASYRGQLARVQERWFDDVARTDAAHAALERATANLSASKAQYAELVRIGPIAPRSDDSALRLTEWNATDRGHRRWHAATTETHYLVQAPRIARR